ncbi:response regulator [Dictyobacter kobayashii]|uniref:Response regulator n=1 Tax=Dictyobacter kobayashii TaxID=2014872 RepID=A0A402AS77_9CHLR|nr:response regulator [Dictyobacter kobayashii]GCE21954.1 response regulator [Dictyobacter kobayashii]
MEKEQQIRSQQTSGNHILIVDDDPILGGLLVDIFQDESYQVSHVLSGERAQDVLQTETPMLVLLDYHLPGMNGLELAHWMRKREASRHTPIILMSADVPAAAHSEVHLRTLRKPFELERILQWVAELLAA